MWSKFILVLFYIQLVESQDGRESNQDLERVRFSGGSSDDQNRGRSLVQTQRFGESYVGYLSGCDPSVPPGCDLPGEDSCDDVYPPDSSVNCVDYQRFGLCTDLEDTDYCKKSCGKCKCEDEYLPQTNDCTNLVLSGACEDEIVKGIYCQKSCGYCSDDSTPTTATTPTTSSRCIEAEALECDVEALLSFKNALTRGQELFESWSGNDPCSWDYITCSWISSTNYRVTKIDLDWGSVNLYRMTGILSPQWSQLRYLTSLQIAAQNISGSLVAEYSVLDKMEVFWVYKTDISSTLPKEYSVWTSLTNFATSFNNLIGSVPEEYSLWELVEEFYIGQNQKLGGTIPVQFSTWKNMYDFHISSCQFSGSLPATFSLWENCCDRFYVFDNQLTGTLPPQYSTMLKMNEFLVLSNMITGSLPRQFSTFRDCIIFFAFQNQLTGTLPSQYSTMTKMERMSVSSNNLSGSLPKEFSSMMSLQLFQSFNNKISSIIPLEWSVIDSADIDV